MYDVIIIGKGPAGISASLYTVRGKLNTLVIGEESYLKKSHKIDNFYGFPGGISGEELLELGEKQTQQLGVIIKDDSVIDIKSENDIFKVVTKIETLETKTIILATGQTLNKVKIEGLENFEGKGIHYCVACDGFFYNNAKVGILGYTDYAAHEAMMLLDISKDITIYTNGNEIAFSDANNKKINENNIKINKDKISNFYGDNNLEGINFINGENEKIDGIFIAYGTASSVDFARKLGVFIEKGSVVVDKNYMTNVNGLFAAGDCTGGFKQVSVAVGQGAIAGQKVVEYLKEKRA